ncbi:SULT1 [Mytilus edulis]|uniref:SULT1 n=1 Tax=Mytilus edulis TaxID=6550 RepID=A0A8S3RF96_MYTED|nr:SULT1 [Mytilus edulis]
MNSWQLSLLQARKDEGNHHISNGDEIRGHENNNGEIRTSSQPEWDGISYPSFIPFREKGAEKAIQDIMGFKSRESDILLATHCKSGTHWIYEIMQMLLRNTTELEKGAKSNSMLEGISDLSSLDSIPSPRILDTHCSFKYLPKQHIEKKNKIVHIVRNPKDVCVSFYHHASKDKFTNFNGSWNDFFDLWMAGKLLYGAWYDYELEMEQAEKDFSGMIYTCYYEDMKQDPEKEIKKLADFLGVECSATHIEEVAKATSFKNMQEKSLTSPKFLMAKDLFIEKNSNKYMNLTDICPGNVYDLYTGDSVLNVDNAQAQSLTQPIKEHFKSEIVNKWNSVGIVQVRLAIHKNGTEVAFFLFDGKESNKTDWFLKERLQNSSYTDLQNSTSNIPTNVFSIYGLQGFLNIYRSFYINSVWGGCASDAGWLMVYDTHNVAGCPWEGYYLSDKPAILYSPISTRVRFSQIDRANLICHSSCLKPIQLDAVTHCYKPCDTIIDVTSKIRQLREDLTINRKNTTSYRRTLQSVYEDRTSAKTMGLTGATFLVSVVCVFIYFDCVRFKTGRSNKKRTSAKDN